LEKLNAYESFLVVDASKTKDQIDEIVSKFRALIEKNAKLDGEDIWGRRRLAYQINHKTEGYYVLFYFTSKPEFPLELERQYRITDGVLRFLVARNEDGFVPDLTKSLAPKDGAIAATKKSAEKAPATEEAAAEEVVEEAAPVEEVAPELAEEKPKKTPAKKKAVKKEEVVEAAEEATEEEKPKKVPAKKKATKKEEVVDVVEEKPKKVPAKKKSTKKETEEVKASKEEKDA